MANIKSQIKRNRQNEKRQLRNKAIRSELKTRSKNVLAADSGDADQAAEALRLAQQRIDTAVAKGVLHKNTAARRKSALPPGAVLPEVRRQTADGRPDGLSWKTRYRLRVREGAALPSASGLRARPRQ